MELYICDQCWVISISEDLVCHALHSSWRFQKQTWRILADPDPYGRNKMILTSIHVNDLSVNIGPSLAAEVKNDTANIGFPSNAAYLKISSLEPAKHNRRLQ
jgi:hypothetical protein